MQDNLLAGKSQDNFKISCALCEFDCCKTGRNEGRFKYLGLLLKVLRNLDTFCIKHDSIGL